MHLIIQNLEDKIYVIQKFLKDIKLKITPTCFGSYAIHHQIEKNEMGGACGAYGAGERGLQGSGRET